jgi:peptidoglycan/xylan/chitin deacetylase (PgdA/CDA1 family)
MERAFATLSFGSVLQLVRTDVASFWCFLFCERTPGCRGRFGCLGKRSIRLFAALLSLCVALAACKRNPRLVAPVPEVAKTAPAPSATPIPGPVNLKSEVIVLCYHRFEDKPKDSLAINPADFEAQMQALKDNGITVISMEDFLAWRRGEKGIPEKAAIISIDDGYLSGYNVAWPILNRFGYPFTMFIYTDYVKGGPKSGGQSISWDQLAEMRDAGVDIEGHTVSHSSLNARKGKTDEQYLAWLKGEIVGSKELLEKNLGIQVKAFAYPYGLHNQTVRDVVKQAGYEAAFTVWGRRIAYGADPLIIGRYAIESTKPNVFEEAVNFKGAVEGGNTGVMPAAATMVTQPMDGETVTDSLPEIKANLATLGNVDPKSVSMRLSGLGLVPATYDPATKLISYKVTQKLHGPQITVIVSATVNARKTEARWSFNIGSNEAPR